MGPLRRVSHHRPPQHRRCLWTEQRAIYDRRSIAQRRVAQRSKQTPPQSRYLHLPGSPCGRAEAAGPVSPPAASTDSPRRLGHAVLRL